MIKEIYGLNNKVDKEADFLEFFEEETKKHYTSSSNYSNWKSSFNYLYKYTNNNLKIRDIDYHLIDDFRDYLLKNKKLSQNSKSLYFNKFKATLKEAYKEGIIEEDFAKRIKNIKPEETTKEYLTTEEIKLISQTECDDPLIKNSFMFSIFTGLRFSDVKNLKWKQIQHSPQIGYYIRFIQKKTKGNETLPIPEKAMSFLDNRGKPEQYVFENLEYSSTNNRKLQKWIDDSGVYKKVTFHVARHTFATLQLTLGTDIYTVSKMLGHKELKTTQVYAKIIDKKKTDAANLFEDIDICKYYMSVISDKIKIYKRFVCYNRQKTPLLFAQK